MRAKRGSPVASCGPMAPEQDKHEKMLSEMHDALYTLGNKMRPPMGGNGDKLLPKGLAPAESPEASMARMHIETLHKAMKAKR